jgi:putative spermidine/putrescine transport system substrate-binding protein
MTTKTRRTLLRYIGGASAAVLAAESGLIPAAFAAGGQFVWSSTGGTWGDKLREIFVETPGFAQQTGLEPTLAVEMDPVAASKVLANCGNPPFDVSSAGEPEIALTNGGNCLAEYDMSIVTKFKDIYEGARIGSIYAPFAILAFGIVWNRDRLAAPESWEVLADPTHRGRVAIPAYGWYGMPWLHAVNKDLGGDEDNIDPGLEFVAKLVQENEAIIVENADHGSQLFQRDEVDVMPFWNGRAVRLGQSGLPTEFKMIRGGLTVGVGFTILKGAKNPEAANIFVNNTLEPALQTAFASWSKYPPTNRMAEVPADLEAFRLSDEVFALTSKLDWDKVNVHRSEYLERWNREVLR